MKTRSTHLESWMDAVANGRTTLSLEEWSKSEYRRPDPDEVADLTYKLADAREALRNCLRPLAVEVLGDWADDDRAAHRLARSWSATVNTLPDGTGPVVVLTDTLYAAGHNETATVRRHTIDLTEDSY